MLLEELAEQVRFNKRMRASIERHKATTQADTELEPSVSDYELWDLVSD